MLLLDLREKIPNDTFTALELNSLLDKYANKAQKISSMMRRGEIVQIRRGLYAFSHALRRGLLSDGVLANQIYGPSYVSEDFALSYYGLIPEYPAVVTSVTIGRSREFDTPFGHFSYRYSRSRAYSVCVTVSGDDSHRFLIATPEKALYDKALFDKRFDGDAPEEYLLEDLRLDEERLANFKKENIQALLPFMVGRMRKLGQYLEAL